MPFAKTDVKLIVTDLDRTLLRDDKTISDYSHKILRKCRDRNIRLVFATARPKISVDALNCAIEPDALIYHSGAVIMAGGRTLCRYGIRVSEVREILGKIEKKFPEATISVIMNDVMYTNFDADMNWAYTRIDFCELPGAEAEKIIVGSIPLDDIKLAESMLPAEWSLTIDSGAFGFIQNNKATKWEGVKTISAYFGVDTKNMVSFGDDYSDLEMIKYCGTGVAMRNGIDEAKFAADFVCDTNENDGVAKWIENGIL